VAYARRRSFENTPSRHLGEYRGEGSLPRFSDVSGFYSAITLARLPVSLHH
jgi:hypothetical protein